MGIKTMKKAAELLSCTAVDLLCEPDILTKAKDEFENRKEGKDYECLIPDDLSPPLELNRDTMEKYPV